MRKVVLSILILLCCSFARSQSLVSISGQVTDENDNPVAYATVEAVNMQEATLSANTLTNPFGYYEVFAWTGYQYVFRAKYRDALSLPVSFFVVDDVENLDFVIDCAE